MSGHVRNRATALLAIPLVAALAFGAPARAAADESVPAATAEPAPAADEPAPTEPEPEPTATAEPTAAPTQDPAATATPTFTPASEQGIAAPSEEPSSEPAKPAILTLTLPKAYWGRPYSATLDAVGTGTLLWSLTGGQLPAGLTLAPSGAITGTPTKIGTYSAEMALLDDAALTVTRTLTLVVTAALDAAVSAVGPADVRYSYRSGCPVKPVDLRLLQMNYWGYDGKLHRGRMVMRANVVDDLRYVFAKAFADKFPLHSMNLVETYQGSDVKAMRDDNTSAFNCRHVTGNPTRLSQHSYGNAIDINTKRNPYVTGKKVYPHSGKKYLDRSPLLTGMIGRKSALVKAFAHERWKWGARWSHPDYQHFSSNGG